MEKYLSPKYIIIALIIVVLVLSGILFWQYQQEPISPAGEENIPEEGGQIVHRPWSDTAERYYPGGGNAIDFRDGAQGDFEIDISKSGDAIKLSWPKEIKVVEAKVYDIGTLYDLQDHKIVFNIINFDINKILNPSEEAATPTVQEIPAQPEVYLSPSYEIGEIPKGFFENPLATVTEGAVEDIFEAGKRYSVELSGVDKDGKMLFGYYTFNYEE